MTHPPPTSAPSESWADAFAYPLATLGAIVGAFAGALLHKFAYSSGFYAIILVGAGAGFGTFLFTRKKNLLIGIIAALVAVTVGVWAEWWAAPFTDDTSFSYFLTHFQTMAHFRLLLHALNPIIAFFIAARK